MSLSIVGADGGCLRSALQDACFATEIAKPDAKPSQFGRATDPYRDVLHFLDLVDHKQASSDTAIQVVRSLAQRPGHWLMPNVKLVSSGDAATDRATMMQLKAFFAQDPSLAQSVLEAGRQSPVYVVVGSKATDGADNYKAVNFQAVNADGKRLGQVVALPGGAVRNADFAAIDNEFFEVGLRAEIGDVPPDASQQSATAALSDLSALEKESGVFAPDVEDLYKFLLTRYEFFMESFYQPMYEGITSESTPAYRQAFADALNERLNELVDQSGYADATVGFEVSRSGEIVPALIPREPNGNGQVQR
jgi:hypothetical protein